MNPRPSITTDTELAVLRVAIKEANSVLTAAYGTIIKHETKDKGIVTKYDLLVEDTIKQILSPLGYPFLAEETAAEVPTTSAYWVIDPIDATTAFAHANPLLQCLSHWSKTAKLPSARLAVPHTTKHICLMGCKQP